MDNKIVWEKTCKEIDQSIVKVELTDPEQRSENIDLNFVEVPSMEGYHSNIPITPRRRKKCCRRPMILPKHKTHKTDLILKEKRFRPIRPKPLQSSSSILHRQRFELPVVNMTTLPNHVFVPNTMIKENIQYVTPTNVSNEINNCIGLNSSNVNNSDINNSNVVDSNINIINSNTIQGSENSNIVNIQSVTEENKIDKTVETQNSTTMNSNCNNNSNSSNSNNNNNSNDSNSNCNELYNIKATSKSHKNSIELFFESMAQTVLNFPNEVQADIKMQICKIVTEAEIRYCYKS